MRRTQRKIQKKFSEEEALPKAWVQKNYVEENAGISEEETVAGEKSDSFSKKMNGCIASRADLRKNLPLALALSCFIVCSLTASAPCTALFHHGFFHQLKSLAQITNVFAVS